MKPAASGLGTTNPSEVSGAFSRYILAASPVRLMRRSFSSATLSRKAALSWRVLGLMLRKGLDVGLAARMGWAGGVAGLVYILGVRWGEPSMVVLGQPLWAALRVFSVLGRGGAREPVSALAGEQNIIMLAK